MSTEGKILDSLDNDATVCDMCKCFMRLMSPRNDGWMEEDEMKAVCVYKHKIIKDGLKTYEAKGIERPYWCPKLQNDE